MSAIEAVRQPNLDEVIADIDAISFDVWLTLIRSNPDYKQVQADHVAKELGIDDPNYVDVMRAADRDTDHESDITGVQYGPEARIQRSLGMLGLIRPESEVARVAEEIQDIFVEYPPRLMESDLLDSLDTIRRAGMGTVILSNTGFINGKHMRQALSEIGIYQRMDNAVFSNEAGVAKPDPRIFQAVAKAAGVAPVRMMHIGDNIKADYFGATNAGLNGVHLSPESDALLSVSSIAELAKRIEAVKGA